MDDKDWGDGVCAIVDEIAEERGVEYDTDENIAVLAGYIEQFGDPESFRKYVEDTIEPQASDGDPEDDEEEEDNEDEE
jgi:hypothetical protein